MKKNKKVVTIDETTIEQPQISVEATPKQLGRPTVSNSKRQQMIADRQAKIDAGTLKRGRKSDPNSKRQLHLAYIAEMRSAGLLTGKKGRPVNPDSKNQQTKSEKQARIAANGGIPLGPGRPKVKAVSTDLVVDIS